MLKDAIKTNLSPLYSLARHVRDAFKNESRKKATRHIYLATHQDPVGVNFPLAIIMVSSDRRRLNIVFDEFTEKTLLQKEPQEILKTSTEFAHENKFELRLISRNILPSPKLYHDFVLKNSLKKPAKLSFYTDCKDRVSNSVRRLDVSENDFFFSETDYKKLKEWIRKYEKQY